MDINTAVPRDAVLPFHSAQPDHPRDDRVAPGSVWVNYLAGRRTIFDDRASWQMVAEFRGNKQDSERCPITSVAVAQTELRGRDRIFGNQLAAIDDRELLVSDANYDLSSDRKSPRKLRGREQDRHCPERSHTKTTSFGIFSVRRTANAG